MPDAVEPKNPQDDPFVTFEPVPDLTIDITQQRCPMTFVRTRLGLDRLATGQVLAVLLTGEEPRRNVPATAIEQGHTVLARIEQPGDVLRLLIRKGRSAPAG